MIESPGLDPIQVADTRFAMARILEADDPGRARTLAEQAASGYAALGNDNPRAQRIAVWLAHRH
jgi:hypothetical protein